MSKRKKPSRANGKENKMISEFLHSRCKALHGKLLCQVCLGHDCGCRDDISSTGKLVNEHIDGDSNNWHPDNLRLSSQSCNMKEWHRNRTNQKVGVEKKREEESERGRNRDLLLKQMISSQDLKMETVSMWKSTLKHEVFKYTEKEMMKSPEGVWIEELANDCANLFDLSVNKCREYILSKTYKTGPYKTEEQGGKKYLIWKIRFLENKYREEIKKYTDES